MKSIAGKILWKCIGAVLFVMASYLAISTLVKISNQPLGERLTQLNDFQLDMMVKAYQAGGSNQLARYIQQVRRAFPGLEYYLTDATGKDLASGYSDYALLTHAKSVSSLYGPPGYVVVSASSPDGQYRLITVAAIPSTSQFALVPYLLIILTPLVWLCYSLIADIAFPLKSLTQTLDCFGEGDLSARMRSGRKDQIGNLARSFDVMADRIQVLLLAERRLLQDVAHELRSPLARLSLATGLLNADITRERGLGQIRREIERLTRLAGGLLQVTRAEGDPLCLVFARINLPCLLDEILSDCRLEADAKACRIDARLAQDVTVTADAELLRRAVENIVRNAIKYSPKESVIDLALECGESGVSIAVRDYGPGVPDEMLSKIVRPFFRVDESRDSLTGGMGLGLAIANRAIQLHNGQIIVRNASPGLHVSMLLPLQLLAKLSG